MKIIYLTRNLIFFFNFFFKLIFFLFNFMSKDNFISIDYSIENYLNIKYDDKLNLIRKLCRDVTYNDDYQVKVANKNLLGIIIQDLYNEINKNNLYIIPKKNF